MAERVKVEGLQELGRAMQRLSADVNKNIARAMTNAGAQVVKRAAINKAPVDTGNLKKNIIVKRINPTSLTSEHIVTVRKGKLTQKQRQSGLGDAFYGRFVEFGTVKMPAKPFLRPAFDENGRKAIDAMKERGAKRIEAAARKAKQ